ncbi:TonB-dependent receptor plug domain-containing protein [Pseudoalteromonas denitrificans]|uniref:TonB-dependent receptor plug domain-containing protein n=1 Tax=Pseudoalteromonas denitrificans TaxID=43656 RepID=UPI0015A552B4|nr:TonB-dependent receptor plug domain-containing protein [Pseudoalteromonas denitrificans]
MIYPCFAFAQNDDLFSMEIDELLQITVISSNGIEESLIDAPASMVILSESDFIKRGYNNLAEILVDLPGLDTIQTNGTSYITSYQRGYRTPFMTRTLFMINGIVDNHLWSQDALISRQYPISMIKQVEVLYGPSSVRYGPNAFLGVINVITKKGLDLAENHTELLMKADIGSWDSNGLELFSRGNFENVSFDISGRIFTSNEEDLSERWGFLSNNLYNNQKVWGPLLQHQNDGEFYGKYNDKTDDWGLFANFKYQDLKLSFINWQIDEGYGTQYAADRGQNNGDWQRLSKQVLLEHDWQYRYNLNIKSNLLYRKSRVWGNWAEATPDWNQGMSEYSYISISNWNSSNNAIEIKQDFDYTYSEYFRYLLGWRLKRSDLTKAYDVPGYWGGYSSTISSDALGPYGFGAGVFHSTDLNYDFDSKPIPNVPNDNRVQFNDAGIYFSVIYDSFPWRTNLGIRYDYNQIWGSSTNPRVSSIFKFNDNQSAIKLVYGEAFQEPPALQLYGGWSGRLANPDLAPEKAKNIEVILMHNSAHWLHDMSLYRAFYDNVIREDAINNGKRVITGFEYKGRFEYSHFLQGQDNITGYIYYTYTNAKTDRIYDHNKQDWVNQTKKLGDISPHKINMLIDMPFYDNWHLNIKGNYLHSATLYSRNPLNIQNIKVASCMIFDASLSYKISSWNFTFKALNIFDRKVFSPGVGKADSGNDFSKRSLGFINSLTVEPGRSVWLSVRYQFDLK